MTYIDELKNDLDKIKISRKKATKEIRSMPYGKYRIRPYFLDIKILKKHLGFSFEEIRLWLETNKNIKISKTGLYKSYNQLLELEKENSKNFD